MFVGGGIAVGLVAPPLLINVLGFTPGGVAAGSAAAGIHAGIGNVAAGSVFAALQSAGAAGLAPGTCVVVAGLGGTAGHFLDEWTKKRIVAGLGGSTAGHLLDELTKKWVVANLGGTAGYFLDDLKKRVVADLGAGHLLDELMKRDSK